MNYVGSKARIVKDIMPIILRDRKPGQYYVEPFCGGCNSIMHAENPRIASDANKYLIAMWRMLLYGKTEFPINITREMFAEYRKMYQSGQDYSEDELAKIGWVGFTSSYRAGGYEKAYGRISCRGDHTIENIKNILSQIPLMGGVEFKCLDYRDLQIPKESIIYCDPPYEGVLGYSESIDHNQFWQWCRDKVKEGHSVFVSEYNAPNDFVCIWSKDLRVWMACSNQMKINTEKLFVHESVADRYTANEENLSLWGNREI